MTSNTTDALFSLMPIERLFVMDLVEQAGIDIKPWHTTADGRSVANPRANPSFCYDWAFGSEKEGFLVCVWHASLTRFDMSSGPAVVYNENFRDLALSLDRIAIDRTQPRDERNRARSQAHRARAFDRALQLSYRRGLPVRVIVNEGDQRDRSQLGKSSSSVKSRKLDSESWFMHAYANDSGDTLLIRGHALPPQDASIPNQIAERPVLTDSEQETATQELLGSVTESEILRAVPQYVDQFSVPGPSASRETTVLVRDRSAAVREEVLKRAGGICELCNKPGFITASGSVYLETHHVVPLAEDGPDHASNVVAICPKDHRRAHFAMERDEIAMRLTEILVSKGASCDPQSYS